jgi:hypothetical protein
MTSCRCHSEALVKLRFTEIEMIFTFELPAKLVFKMDSTFEVESIYESVIRSAAKNPFCILSFQKSGNFREVRFMASVAIMTV